MYKIIRWDSGSIRGATQKYGNILIAISLALSGLMPIILSSQAGAAQLTSRSVTIANSAPSATGVDYVFNFTLPSTAIVQSMVFEFCTAALSTCTKPTGMNVGYATASAPTGGGDQVFSEATNFTEYTGANAGGCNGQGTAGDNTATTYCVQRTDGDAETAAAKTIKISGIGNPSISSGNNQSVYVRVYLYSGNAFTTLVHEGTVAASIVNQLTVTGRVQERLIFCVFALDNTAGSSATVGSAATNLPTDCAANEANASTSVDLGIVDHLSIADSPVANTPPTSLGNDRFGAAMINTNAGNGVTLSYFASADTTGGATNELRAFRVPGATCNASGTDVTDLCFISADDSTGEAFTAGTERFGVQIACVLNSTVIGIGSTSNLGKDGTGTYTAGTGASGSFNSVYDAGRANLDDDVNRDCETDPGGTLLNEEFGWRDSGTAQPLISSVKVVDDELVKLRYAATANATTPTGTYTVSSTYIATPVF